jgi:replicative DNA helicase
VHVGGADRIREIASIVPAAANAAHWARIVRQRAISRNVIATGARIQQVGWDPEIDAAQKVERAQVLGGMVEIKLAFDPTPDASD